MSALLLMLLTATSFQANQGQGQNDGGVAWQVTCTNCSGGGGSSSLNFDGGAVTAFQGGTWNVATHAVTQGLGEDGGRAWAIAGPVTVAFDGGYVSVANFPATQPVSGTVTCNAGSGTLAVSLAAAPTTAVTLATAPALVASSAVIGHVLVDSTSTTAVTQATGTNLHAVLDTTSTTACTQATGTNLHVVTDATSVLAANQSVNVAQMNGVATTMGNGVAGTGVQRVAIASDNTAFTTNARVTGNGGGIFDAANNATAPASIVVIGAQLQSSATATAGTAGQVGNVVAGLDHVLFTRFGGPVSWSCFVEAITATTQCLAAPGAGLKAYVTSVSCSNEAATVQGIDVIYGTGSNCVTSPVALTHKFQMGTLATTSSPMLVQASFQSPLQPAAANAICVRPTAATAFGCTLTGFTAP